VFLRINPACIPPPRPTICAGGIVRPALPPPSRARAETREERELLAVRCGITNLVARATVAPIRRRGTGAGRARLERAARYRPRIVAIVGIGAYRTRSIGHERPWDRSWTGSPGHACGCCRIRAD
jgi:hypothetical protein